MQAPKLVHPSICLLVAPSFCHGCSPSTSVPLRFPRSLDLSAPLDYYRSVCLSFLTLCLELSPSLTCVDYVRFELLALISTLEHVHELIRRRLPLPGTKAKEGRKWKRGSGTNHSTFSVFGAALSLRGQF